ncbi:MAG: hypothetical protein HY010_01545 [Acidobacteria bacterium]|nr:hypothetical protein [Acidobacteriota bacterium]
MKVLAILILSLLIIVASLFFLAFCLCAADVSLGGHASVGERILWAIAAVLALGGIIGMVKLARKLNRSIGL